ncbi:MAG: class I SAM-dependent methyltransferase [Pirellulales bacterium]|nr:class I SAM-dependent methyltransferase [Pirellulales bacterium]
MTAAETLRILSDDLPRARLTARLSKAIERRARYALRRRSGPEQGQGVERTLDGLLGAVAGGEVAEQGAAAICAAGVALVDFGAVEYARRCVQQALKLFRGDGALPDATGGAPSLFATALFLRLADRLNDDSKAELPVGKVLAACEYIVAHLDRGGRLLADDMTNSLPDRWGSPLARLACLAPVANFAACWQEGHWQRLIERAVQRATSIVELAPWTTPSHLWAQAIDALLELGGNDAARRHARWLDLAQRSDGGVASRIDAEDLSAWATAHAAAVWFELGNRERGDRAMQWLASKQTGEGRFVGSGDDRLVAHRELWTTIHYLRAAQAQVRASFAGQRADLPETIDAADGRYRAVVHWLRQQEGLERVLDAGCGAGRFLRRLRDELPGRHWLGIDASDRTLQQLPRLCDLEWQQGDLLRLPVQDAACDAAYMVEALEHSLVPRRAVEELCRAVRPGGVILIIDKCRSHQALSRHEPWERWFAADEVTAWLTPHCEDIAVTSIPHGHHQQPTGLFLCWTARKHNAIAQRRAA